MPCRKSAQTELRVTNECSFGKQLVLSGNDDAETVVTHWFAPDRKVTARFVRVVCLSCRPELICCLRFELFGCDGGVFFSPFPENNASFIS